MSALDCNSNFFATSNGGALALQVLIQGPPVAEGEAAVLCNHPVSNSRDDQLVWTPPGKTRIRRSRLCGNSLDSPLSCSTPPGSQPPPPDSLPSSGVACNLSRSAWKSFTVSQRLLFVVCN